MGKSNAILYTLYFIKCLISLWQPPLMTTISWKVLSPPSPTNKSDQDEKETQVVDLGTRNFSIPRIFYLVSFYCVAVTDPSL